MKKSRRTFVCALGAGVVAIPLGSLAVSAQLQAADRPQLDPDDPTAKSLEYTHESQDANKRCSGCQFYTGGSGSEWGPCVIFPGKHVNAQGLCKSWYARA